MTWDDYPTYSLSARYDVVKRRDNDGWIVVIKGTDGVGWLRFEEPNILFDTRSDAKQWCEMHRAVGA